MCPYCEKAVVSVRIEHVELYESDGGTLKGLKYYCPFCNKILSVGVDPVAQKDDIVHEILGHKYT